jgi:hypothetical protein
MSDMSFPYFGIAFFPEPVIRVFFLKNASSGHEFPGVQIKDLAALAVPRDDHLRADVLVNVQPEVPPFYSDIMLWKTQE